MIDPITAVGLATSAYNAIKAGLAVGERLQEITGSLVKWGKAFSDFPLPKSKSRTLRGIHSRGRTRTAPLKYLRRSKKMSEMRKEIKKLHQFQYGPSAWEEVLHIEAQMRKQRKEEVYRKAELQTRPYRVDCRYSSWSSGIAGLVIVGYFSRVDIRGSGDVVFGLVHVYKQQVRALSA